jgi:hypothetical protein
MDCLTKSPEWNKVLSKNDKKVLLVDQFGRTLEEF